MIEHKKSPAQGGEMPPVERAAITGSGGIDTVRGATPAGNAAHERNTNAAALDRDIAHLIDCSEGGIARVPRETFVRLRALLSSPRAGLPRHVLASLECTAVWLEKGNDPQDAARELRACLAKIDAAQAVAADGEAQDEIEGIARAAGCTNVDLIGDRAKAIERLTAFAVQVRAAVSPATADRICTLIPLSERHPIADDHPRVIVFTDGSDFNGAQFFDVSADTLNECFYESPDEQPEVCRHATHWMPRPSLHNAAPATADERAHNACCPFCGSDDFYTDSALGKRQALCNSCEAAGPTEETDEEAIASFTRMRASQAAAPADAREPVGRFDKSLNQIRWRDGLVNADFADRQPFFTQPVGTTVDAGESFQSRVHPWLLECFGPTIATDTVERNHRFLEEAIELVQSLGCTASEAHQLVDYTFGRPVGEPMQEVGGVMVTLAALCLASELDMHQAGETELARISEPAMVLKIRAKQAAKPKHSPLPQAVPARSPYEWRDTGPLETGDGGAA